MSIRGLEAILAILIGINIGISVTVILRYLTSTNCSSNNRVQERIVGGIKIEINKFAFMAGIVALQHYRYPTDILHCGCCIISRKWVLSAAHCADLLKKIGIETKYVVIVSNNKEWKKGVKHHVEKIIANRYYNDIQTANDTALFKVKTPFTLIHEVPIALAGHNYKYTVNKTATVVGWGFNETDADVIQVTLFGVNVTVFSQKYCKRLYGEENVTPDMFCAGAYEGGKDACQMDSGGPIVAGNVLIGIVSWGGECGNLNQPGVYARTSYFHPWFREVESQEKEKIGFTIKDY